MKKFKKVLFILVGLIAIVAIGLATFLQVRKYNAKSELIHVKSTAVVKIAIDDIIIDVLKNELANTDFFKKDSDSDTTKEKQDLDIGLRVPAYMYFFCIEENYTDLYSYQRLDDEAKFIETLLKQLKLDSTSLIRDGDYWSISAKGEKLNFIGNASNVLISISSTSYGKMDALKEMWAGRAENMQKVESVEMLQSDDNSANIVVLNLLNKDSFSLTLNNGVIKSTAKLYSHVLKSNVSNKVRKMSEDDILNGYVNFDFKPLLSKYSFFLDKNVQIKDLLSNSFDGYADIQWKKGEVTQQDTVITYEYDDNFEQVEKKELRDEQVPIIVATFKGTSALNNFFPDKMFYKFSKMEQNGYLVISTSSDQLKAIDLVESTNFMELQYNYDESISSYLNSIPKFDQVKSIQIIGKTVNTEMTQFDAEIKMINSNLHPIKQLF